MKLSKSPSTYISIGVVFLWILLVALWYSYFIDQDISIESAIFGTQDYIRANILMWIVLFIWVYVIRPLFFIPATPFDLFSGMVFWPILWFIVSSTSAFLSIMFTYWIWYFTGGVILEKKKYKKWEKLKNKLRKNTFQTTIIMRLLMLPFDLSNYICWVLQAPYIKYVCGTWLWVLPVMAVFIGAWSAFYGKDINNYETLLQNVNYTYLMLSSAFFIIMIIASKYMKKKFRDISI